MLEGRACSSLTKIDNQQPHTFTPMGDLGSPHLINQVKWKITPFQQNHYNHHVAFTGTISFLSVVTWSVVPPRSTLNVCRYSVWPSGSCTRTGTEASSQSRCSKSPCVNSKPKLRRASKRDGPPENEPVRAVLPVSVTIAWPVIHTGSLCASSALSWRRRGGKRWSSSAFAGRNNM